MNFVRDNVDLVRAALDNKRTKVDLDRLLELDVQRRQLQVETETLRAEQNRAGEEIAKESDPEKKSEAIGAMKQLKDRLRAAEERLEPVRQEFELLLLALPNVPFDDVPVGPDESANQVLHSWGEPKKFDFPVKDHLELGEALGLINVERAAEVSGSRFVYLVGGLARMQFALLQYVLNILTDREQIRQTIERAGLELSDTPFVPVVPPLMIRPEAFARMARLEPREERYHIPSDDLYLIGSAEHTLGPLHMDQLLKEADLPLRYFAYTAAFRREAGSYGQDTRGIIRQHQFDKIEMETFCLPESSRSEQELLVALQERFLQDLELPYQVMNVCTGDMGKPDARQIDMECWMPGQGKYRETHSADLMTDYQSRRLGTRVRRNDGEIQYVHMNDATALAMGRILVAIIENGQQADGRISVPKILVPMMGGLETIG